MAKFWRDPQNIIAIGVTLISVCALVVSITQTRIMVAQSELMEKQAKASVLPILELEVNRAFDLESRKLTEFRLVLSNNGVGPANILDVRVRHKDVAVQSWGGLFKGLNLPDSIPNYATTGKFNKTTIQAGSQLTLLDLSENPSLANYTNGARDDIIIEIEYSSIYGDYFYGQREEGGWTNTASESRRPFSADESFKN